MAKNTTPPPAAASAAATPGDAAPHPATPEEAAGHEALYEKLARDAARLMVVHEAGRILRSTHDPHRLASELLRVIADAVFSRSGCVAAMRGDELEILEIGRASCRERV